MHRWGALYAGGMFTNVLLQAILYLRAAMLRGLAGRTDTRLMAAIRVFIALECVGLIVVAYFMYDVWVLAVVGYDVEDPNFQFRDPPPDPWGSIILYGTMTFFGGGHLCINQIVAARSARWRGGVGLTSLDSVIKVALSPRNDFTKGTRLTD